MLLQTNQAKCPTALGEGRRDAVNLEVAEVTDKNLKKTLDLVKALVFPLNG